MENRCADIQKELKYLLKEFNINALASTILYLCGAVMIVFTILSILASIMVLLQQQIFSLFFIIAIVVGYFGKKAINKADTIIKDKTVMNKIFELTEHLEEICASCDKCSKN